MSLRIPQVSLKAARQNPKKFKPTASVFSFLLLSSARRKPSGLSLTRSHWRYSRLDQELHQSCVPTGGSSMQRCPQLAVAGVDAGTGVQQALNHLHKVIDAALRGSARKQSAESQLSCSVKQQFTGKTRTHMQRWPKYHLNASTLLK